jgi:hypothetical protein
MSGICGWFCRERAGPAGADVIATMAAAAINRFDGSAVRIACADFGALAAAATGSEMDVFQGDAQFVATRGHARFTGAELAGLAQRHGISLEVLRG